MSGAYYNEIDPYAAGWLRNLIAAGHIASGDVDERSIADVRPDDLRGYTQCHFFAGIGVWSYALRRAGWDDHRPVWTGSCPCQPFSAAGRGEGFADERHLWPAFHHLIAQRRPPVVFGEQVASKAVDPWIDLVQDDMEGLGYAFGAVPFPSAGVGAPHIRDRAYFVAHAADGRRQHEPDRPGERAALRREPSGPAERMLEPRADGTSAGDVANATRGGCGVVGHAVVSRQSGYADSRGNPSGFLAITHGGQFGEGGHLQRDELDGQQPRDGSSVREGGRGLGHNGGPELDRPGPTNGFWRDPDWLHCRDGRWRPVEPGTFPLVDGSAFRVDSVGPFAGKSRAGMLKGAGNAINAEAATAFISAAQDVLDERRFRLTGLSTMSVAEVDVFA